MMTKSTGNVIFRNESSVFAANFPYCANRKGSLERLGFMIPPGHERGRRGMRPYVSNRQKPAQFFWYLAAIARTEKIRRRYHAGRPPVVYII